MNAWKFHELSFGNTLAVEARLKLRQYRSAHSSRTFFLLRQHESPRLRACSNGTFSSKTKLPKCERSRQTATQRCRENTTGSSSIFSDADGSSSFRMVHKSAVFWNIFRQPSTLIAASVPGLREQALTQSRLKLRRIYFARTLLVNEGQRLTKVQNACGAFPLTPSIEIASTRGIRPGGLCLELEKLNIQTRKEMTC